MPLVAKRTNAAIDVANQYLIAARGNSHSPPRSGGWGVTGLNPEKKGSGGAIAGEGERRERDARERTPDDLW